MTGGWSLDPPAKAKPKAGGWSMDPAGWSAAEVEKVAGPGRITSETRSPAHNREVGGSPTSSHLTGQAIDYVPQGGDLRAAATKLAGAGVPYDQILEEGDHVHVGWGPKMRGQVRMTGWAMDPAPVKSTPALEKSPPAAAGWSVDPSPPPAKAAPAAPKKGLVSRLAEDPTVKDYFVEPWKRVGKDLGVGEPPKPVPRLRDAPVEIAKGLGRTLKTGADLGGAILAPLGAAGDAALARPYGWAMSKVTGGGYKAEDARGAMNTALMALKPGRGGKLAPAGEKLWGRVPKFGKAPAPTPKPGEVYGAEKPRVERLDNALNRLRGHATADKLEVVRAKRAIPKALKTPERQEALYHELEKGMVDPKRELSPEADETLGGFKRYYEEQTDLINDIRQMGAKKGVDVDPYLHDQGYVARRAVGHSPTFDEGLAGARPDPVTGGNGSSLAKRTTAMNSRVPHVMLVPKKGPAQFVEASEAEQLGLEPGGHFVRMEASRPGAKPKPVEYAVRRPTTAEIEANTETRYHKNALDNTLDNVVRLRQVKRNLEVLDAATSDLKAAGLAHRDSWIQRGENGEQIIRQNRSKNKPPRYDEMVEVPNIPQLKGWKFAPEIAEVFKDYKPDPRESHLEAIARVNRFLTSSIFWNPVPHMWNVANHWAVSRGWDWMRPSGYKSLAQNGARAVAAVLTRNEDYQAMLREGSALQLGDIEARNFHEAMLRKGVNELQSDRTAMSTMMRAFKLTGTAPTKLVSAIYKGSSKVLWGASDVLMLQRQYELMQQGMGAREAIKAAEKDIPNYRIPSRVLKSRAMSKMLRDPNVMMFGRYRYGQVKAWGEMFNDLYQGAPEERTEAAGKFIVAMIIASAAYPLADKAVQKVTKNDEARVHRGGAFSIPDAYSQLEKGQKSWLGFMSSVASPAPVIEAGVSAYENKDVFGRNVVEPAAGPREKAVQGGEFVASQIAPIETAIQAAQPQGGQRVLARSGLIDLPPKDAAAKRQRGKRYNELDARRRRKRDPLSKAAHEADQGGAPEQGWSIK